MTGLITAGSALWCLVFAFALHTLVAGRVGHLVPGRVGTDVLPRGVTVLTLAGVAGLTVVTISGWLSRATTATAGWALTVTHIPLATQTVVAGAGLLVAASVITAIIAGHAITGRFVAECVLAVTLLTVIPGHAGQFFRALFGAAVRAAAFAVAAIFQVV